MVTEADALLFRTKDWGPIPRVSRTVPFGYELDESNPNVLQPVPFELEALELAKKHLKQYSYREVAQWLSSVTGRSISHMGLKKRIDIERSRRAKVTALKNWAKRLKEAQTTVEDFEKNYPGSGAKITHNS